VHFLPHPPRLSTPQCLPHGLTSRGFFHEIRIISTQLLSVSLCPPASLLASAVEEISTLLRAILSVFRTTLHPVVSPPPPLRGSHRLMESQILRLRPPWLSREKLAFSFRILIDQATRRRCLRPAPLTSFGSPSSPLT